MQTTVTSRFLAIASLAVAAALFIGGCASDATDEAPPPVAGADAQATIEPQYVDEVDALAETPIMRRAFDEIIALEPRTQEELIMLTEIPAPPFMEEERAATYREMLQAAGADSTWIDEEGNVLALRRGQSGSRTVALGAHLDTVFPEGTDVTVEARGDTLYAPGIGDDARGLMVVLTVLRALEATDLETEGDLLFIGTVGEEGLGDLRGVKHLFRDGGPPIDSWIAVDGDGMGRIIHRALGSHRYRVTVKGPGGHSWGAFGAGNPHHALGRAITHFTDAADPFTREGARTSYNVGRIGGGTSVNSIPFESWMEVDMRSISPERLDAIDALFQDAMERGLQEQNELTREGAPLTMDVEMIGDRPSGAIDPSTPLVQRAMATITYFDTEPELGISSTDSNTPIAKGIPAVTIGRGGEGGGAHSLDEWWLNKDGHLAIQRTLLLAVAEAGWVGP
jgi:acetylornithine deacetylase/succinyl-diaminopimelate desuccinylase-like protein